MGKTCLRTLLVLSLATGVAYPLLVTAAAQVLFPWQAHGSLITRDGVVVGSALVGQRFASNLYFHPRPSAAHPSYASGRGGESPGSGQETGGYDPLHSGATDLGPSDPRLLEGEPPSWRGVRGLAREVRGREGLPKGSLVPVDAVTSSGSGLDPHISLAYALLQVPRVARGRRLTQRAVLDAVAGATEREPWLPGSAPRVHVLRANLALDALCPRPTTRGRAWP